MKNPIPQGKYIPAKKSNGIIISAGMTPRLDGVLVKTGKVKLNDDINAYKKAAIQAAKNAITAVINTLEGGESLEAIISLAVYVNAEEGFTSHSKIADFASEYLVDEFGELAISPRAAIGVSSLPSDAPLEIQIIATYI